MSFNTVITAILYILAIFNIAKSLYYVIKGDSQKELESKIEAILCVTVISLGGQ